MREGQHHLIDLAKIALGVWELLGVPSLSLPRQERPIHLEKVTLLI